MLFSLISEIYVCVSSIVDYDTNALRKKVNEVQKEISAKKKVGIGFDP